MACLQKRAMLVRLKMTLWSGQKQDQRVVDDVADHYNADGRSLGKFNKHLVDPVALKVCKTIREAARQDFYEATLPFDDHGSRLLPSVGYVVFTQTMLRHQEAFERERRRIIDAYPTLVDTARRELGMLFRAKDYPDQSDIGERFAFRTSFRPIPDRGHFVVEVAAEQADRIQEETELAVANAAMDVWHRIHAKAKTLADGLRAYADDDGTVQRRFRDSLVDNVGYLADLLPRLNFMNDPKLTDMEARLKAELCAFEAQALKDNAGLRERVAARADTVCDDVNSILENMSGYV